jgi:tetratricopeptide (TPR) repeat protein
MLAGRNALEAAAFEEARANFQSALSRQGAIGGTEKAALRASLAMAERGLERWDAVIANLREALEIYINLNDREMIGRSFIELTMPSTGLVACRKVPKQLNAGSLTIRQGLVLNGHDLWPPSDDPAEALKSMSRHKRRCGKH